MSDESQATPEEVAQIEALIAEAARAHPALQPIPDGGWEALPTPPQWQALVLDLPVGARIERTEAGFEVFSGALHGAGKSLARAFDSLGATYETREGSVVLVAANGDVLPPE